MRGMYFCITVQALLAIVGLIQGHPQCLDFRAPFQPASTLSFCDQYSELGCCGKSDDSRLLDEYEYIQSTVTAKDWNLCKDFVKDLLCQKCSPYAAHIYDAESSGNPRAFPGLCRNYCIDFHEKCHQMVWFFDASLAVSTILKSTERFCDRVALQDKDYCYPDLQKNSRLNFILTPSVIKNSAPGCLCMKKVGEKLANPLFARPAGDGSGRVFVAEQVGRVHIYQSKRNAWMNELFLDFTAKAVVSRFPGDERGFLGMAFHPNFSSNGRFFVFYSTRRAEDDVLPPEMQGRPYAFRSKAVVSEMKVSENDPNKADPSSEKVLLEIFQPFANHNGGELFFGTDGYLYTFHGDGGGAGDPLKAGQNKSLLLGKVLRLDVDSDPTKPYTIPPDNPFVGENGSKPEIYAYGVRNIWRCGLDRGDRKTGESRGRVLCGDVGQSMYEEIDRLKKGVNYGWNAREGFECYDDQLCGNIGEEELPVAAYSHSVGKSVTGGVFYRGCENPALNGQYIYGDYESRQLFSLTEANGTWNNKHIYLCGSDICQGNLENSVLGKILSFGEDEDGEIYALTSPTVRSNQKNGFMLKIVDPYARGDPELCANDHSNDSRVPIPRRRKFVELGTSGRRNLPKINLAVKVRNRSRLRKRKFSSKNKKRRNKRRKKCRYLEKSKKRKCRKRRRIRKHLSRKKKKRAHSHRIYRANSRE